MDFLCFSKDQCDLFSLSNYRVDLGAGHNIDREFHLTDYVFCYGSILISTIILFSGFVYCVRMTFKKSDNNEFFD